MKPTPAEKEELTKLTTTCLACKGTGKSYRGSFVESGKNIECDCRICRGKGEVSIGEEALIDLLKKSLDLISTLELTLSNATRGWISVEQELPPNDVFPEEYIIAFTHKMSPDVGSISSTAYWYGPNREWEDGLGERLNKINITHWQPLPAPPPEPIPEEKK